MTPDDPRRRRRVPTGRSRARPTPAGHHVRHTHRGPGRRRPPVLQVVASVAVVAMAALLGWSVGNTDQQPDDEGAGFAAIQELVPTPSTPVPEDLPTDLPAGDAAPPPRTTGTAIRRSTKPPARGTGRFEPAAGQSPKVGTGSLTTYRVEVERGVGESSEAFAADVDRILADKRSWAGHGLHSLKRTSTQAPDLIVRLASRKTVESICRRAGLYTGGYSSCRAGRYVMINLDRWTYAVPHFKGDLARYRAYVVNHEFGHGLGYGHQSCPKPGRPAPVMMQQTSALKHCTPNGWPYSSTGGLITGPATL